MKEIFSMVISTILVHNFVLSYFLGLCPFLGISNREKSAWGMGIAVIFVMTLASSVSWLVYHFILVKFNLVFLTYVIFILIIASLVQIVEMFIRKYSPSLFKALGIYLPLITTNCAILGCVLFMITREYGFVESLLFSFSAGIGFLLVLLIMAGIREELEYVDVPPFFQGVPIALITAGLLALTFMGFSGLQ